MPAAALTCCIYSSSAYVPRPYTVIKSKPVAASWSPAHSKKLYKVDGWGAPYFSINSNGNVSVRPYGDTTLPHQEIDLLSVVSNANDALELNAPLIVRFPDVLNDRLESLQAAFDLAIQSQGYGAHYHGIYPVKCNQDRYVVNDIVRFGFGLEVGSKPELLLAMSCLCKYGTRPDAFLVCNGFKDADYVSLALLAKKLHLNVVIVLEQEEELDMVIEVSRKLGAPRPVIGLRAKLRTKHDGHFGSTSGEKGKFGLTTSQILRVVKKLKLNNMVDCLQFLHFHIGSQIPSTSILSDGVSEAAQIYSELVRLGATNMKVIDVGGGLGIDYDGSRSQDSDMSVAYNLEEYAAAVVEAVGLVCNRNGVKHPILCSESGRAIVSHHSVLVFEASSAIAPANNNLSLQHLVNVLPPEINALINHDHSSLLTFADQFKQRCVEQFKQGSLSIEQLAAVDGLCELVTSFNGGAPDIRTYDINLSIFTSLPDFWAIGQLFPIIPIHRHDKKPTLRGILSDLTCDSDGKIDKFIGGESILPLHEQGKEKYHLGVFLAGAYQEALGGFHNLFGCPNIVCVEQSDEAPDGFVVKTTLRGNSCAEVLRIMNHEPQHMFHAIKQRIEEVAGDGYSSIALVNAVACSFNTLPYLDLGNNDYDTNSDNNFVTNDGANVEERLTPTSDLYYVRGPV